MKRGTFVLSPFPFTDLTGRKVRPALVVSRTDRSGSDVVLAFLTTYRGQSPLLPTDLLLLDTEPDFAQTGLKGSALLKLDKLVTLNTSILHGELGELPLALVNEVNVRLRYALDL
jgi:mRNA interferase MazF